MTIPIDIHVCNALSLTKADDLAFEVSNYKILNAFHYITQNKFSGVNGFNTNFFASSWDIVGK